MFGFKKIKQGKIATDALDQATVIVRSLKYDDVDFDEKIKSIHTHCKVAMDYAKNTGDITRQYIYDSLDLIYKMIDNQTDLRNKIRGNM